MFIDVHIDFYIVSSSLLTVAKLTMHRTIFCSTIFLTPACCPTMSTYDPVLGCTGSTPGAGTVLGAGISERTRFHPHGRAAARSPDGAARRVGAGCSVLSAGHAAASSV